MALEHLAVLTRISEAACRTIPTSEYDPCPMAAGKDQAHDNAMENNTRTKEIESNNRELVKAAKRLIDSAKEEVAQSKTVVASSREAIRQSRQSMKEMDKAAQNRTHRVDKKRGA